MSSNYLTSIDGLPTLVSYSNVNPYINEDNPIVAVSKNYDSTCAQVSHSGSSSKFKDFLLEHVFDIYGEWKNEKAEKANYISGFKEYINDNNESINEMYLSKTYSNLSLALSGTLFTYRCEDVNIGILIDNNQSNTIINGAAVIDSNIAVNNKIPIYIKEDEPFMQTISDCNGNVYDFRKGVKLSDFSKFLRMKSNPSIGYYYLDYLPPSNTSVESKDFIDPKESDFITPSNNDYKYTLTQKDSNINFVCYGSMYIIVCSCKEETSTTINGTVTPKDIIDCKPYVTVIKHIGEFKASMTKIENPIKYENNKFTFNSIVPIDSSIGSVLNGIGGNISEMNYYIPTSLINE